MQFLKTFKHYSSVFLVLSIIVITSCGGGSGSSSEIGPVASSDGSGTLYEIELTSTDLNEINPSLPITISFTSQMNDSTFSTGQNGTLKLLDENGNDVNFTINYDETAMQLIITPAANLNYDSEYQIIVTNGISTVEGVHPAETVTLIFKTAKDTDKPAVLNCINSDADAPVVITFSESVDVSSINSQNINVSYENGTLITGNFSYTDDNKIVKFLHNKFTVGSNVKVVIKGVKDVNGNECDEYEKIFTISASPDDESLMIISVSPLEDSQNNQLDCSVCINFTEPLDPSTVNGNTFQIKDESDKKVDGNIIFEDNNSTIKFIPEINLSYSSKYRVILTDEIADLSGNEISSKYYEFETESEEFVFTINQYLPNALAQDVAVNSSIAVVFNSELDLVSVNADSVKLFRISDDSIVETEIIINSSNLVITPIADLDGGQEYRVVLESSIVDKNGNVFEGFEWTFTTEPAINNEPLKVISVSPVNNSTGNWESPLHDSPIIITFSQDLLSDSINSENIKLYNNSEQEVSSSLEIISSKKVRLTPNNNLNREEQYKVFINGAEGGISDIHGNKLTTENYESCFTTLEKLKVISHYYINGSYDKDYPDYESAYSDNNSDSNVEIHSYIAIEFNYPVDPDSLDESVLVKRDSMGTSEIADCPENNQNVIGKIYDEFPDETLRGQYIGRAEIDPLDPRKVIFKHHLVFYANPGGAFDWEHPNWNGLKPNYKYNVSILDAVKDDKGGYIAGIDLNSEREWVFQTTDLDYGLYWFKDCYHGLKYIPGREFPVEYYDPMKPVLIHSHGWQKNSTGHMNGSNGKGNFRDYRRENFLWGGTTDYKWDIDRDTIDAFDPWKNGSDLDKYPNGGGKDWNVGCLYWTQYADNEDKGGAFGKEGPLKPRRAGTAIWSMYGPSSQDNDRAEYAVNEFTGSQYLIKRVSHNSPNKSISKIFVDMFKSSFGDRPDSYDEEFRLTGHSLGNQIVHAILMELKNRHERGTIPESIMPTRFFVIDPYWVDAGFWDNTGQGDWGGVVPVETGYWGREECPVKTLVDSGIIWGNPSPGPVCAEIIRNVQDYYQVNSIKGKDSLVCEMYDVSRTSDGVPVNILGMKIIAGDKNESYREEVAMIYSHYGWIGGVQDAIGSWGQQHNNGRYQVFYSYGYSEPVGGLSQRSSDLKVKLYMNSYYENSQKGRFEYSGGLDTSDWQDDTFLWKTNKVNGGNTGAWKK